MHNALQFYNGSYGTVGGEEYANDVESIYKRIKVAPIENGGKPALKGKGEDYQSQYAPIEMSLVEGQRVDKLTNSIDSLTNAFLGKAGGASVLPTKDKN